MIGNGNEKKCQIGPKTVEQLQADPRVVVPRCDSGYREQNVPDLSDIGCYVDVTSVDEDIYCDNKEGSINDKLNYLDIEGNLTKLFNGDSVFNDEESKKIEVAKKRKSRENKIKDKLMSIFGGTLEDLDEPTRRKLQKRRRHSLPVSINLPNQELLKTYKRCQKRRSVNDLGISAESKQQRIDGGDISAFCEVRRVEVLRPIPSRSVNFNFVLTSDFVSPQKNTKTAVVVPVPNYLLQAKIRRPVIFQSSDIKTVKMAAAVIDLTKEDSGVGRVPPPIKTGHVEVKKEAFVPTPSEQANAPAHSLSMPLLSPVSPAVPPLMEQVLPEKSQTSLGFLKEMNNNLTQRPSPITSVDSRKLPPPPPYHKSQTFNFTMPKQPPPNVSLKPAPPPNVTLQRPPTVTGQPPPNVTLHPPTNVSRTNQVLLKELLANNTPVPPQLFRIAQRDYHLISNLVFAGKLFPYVINYIRWKDSCNRFSRETATFLSDSLKRSDANLFQVYCEHAADSFGRRLLYEISQIDVENFDFRYVLNYLANKIKEHRIPCSEYRAGLTLYEMMYKRQKDCNTPFTKRFFVFVKSYNNKLEAIIEQKSEYFRRGAINLNEKTSVSASQSPFSATHLELLKKQIQQYNMFQTWLTMYYRNASQQKAQTQRPANGLDRAINHTNLNAYRHYQTQRNTQEATLQRQQDLNTQYTRIAPEQNPKKDTPPRVTQNETRRQKDKSVPDPSPPAPVPVAQQNCNRQTVITTASTCAPPPEPDSSTVKVEEVVEINGVETEEIIDLTWIDDGDESEILEEVRESKAFLFKKEVSEDAANRESISPTDSGLGSPVAENSESYKCFCGNAAIFVCACKTSMYCSEACQHNDWTYHQRLCNDSNKK